MKRKKKTNRNLLVFIFLAALTLILFSIKDKVLSYYYSALYTPSIPKDLSGEYDYDNQEGYFNGKKVYSLYYPQQLTQNDSQVLGVDDNKWIEVDLTNQRIYAIEGGNRIMEFVISSGRPWTRTVTGSFRIWTKLRYTRMVGPGYNLPNVPCTMYFYRGYGIHGAYWHNNFGVPMSHGCVNMRPEESCIIYDWANVGTKVIVYGRYPG